MRIPVSDAIGKFEDVRPFRATEVAAPNVVPSNDRASSWPLSWPV